MNENLTLWNKVCITNPENTKDATLGARKITSVDAYSRIMKATELWGPFGGSWGVKNEEYIVLANDLCLYNALLFYPLPDCQGEIPLMSDIPIIWKGGKRDGKINDDWSKKVSTDALTKGLSKLGFNADIYLHKFEDDKYVKFVAEYSNEPVSFLSAQIEALLEQKAKPDLTVDVQKVIAEITDKDILATIYRELKEGFKTNKVDIYWNKVKEGLK